MVDRTPADPPNLWTGICTGGVVATVKDRRRYADLLPGSGHGWGGFVNVARFEVYGKPVPR